MDSVTITESELFEALASASTAPADAVTAKELAAKYGCSRNKVEVVLGKFADANRLATHRVQRPSIDGTPRWVPAYTILPAREP